MKKTFTEIERDATEFRHKFGTVYYTQVAEDCYDVNYVYTNGLGHTLMMRGCISMGFIHYVI